MFNHPYQLQKSYELRYQALQQEARLTAYRKLQGASSLLQRYFVDYLAEGLITVGLKLQAQETLPQTHPKLLVHSDTATSMN
jgi:hypothetical protein